MSARSKIANKLVDLLKTIDGSGTWKSNLYKNVYNKLKFWDEINDFPSVYVNTSTETREYLPGGFKWAYLNVTIRIYVKDEEPETRLEEIFEDIEKIVDENGNLEYETNYTIEDMRILSLQTDEGLLAPTGVGEIMLHIQYSLCDPC